MKIVDPSIEILSFTPDMEKLIERAGRVCWKSEEKITEDSHVKFIKMLKSKNHFSVLEHGHITVWISCDRGVSHELVRHRIANFSQKSTRYVSYVKREIAFINPKVAFDMTSEMYDTWCKAMALSEDLYIEMVKQGATPELARSVLPNSLETEVVMTANVREWLHIFDLRTSASAHPMMRHTMKLVQDEFKQKFPVLFGE